MVRMGRICWAFVSAYGPGCERSEEERDEFWNELTRCVDDLSTRNYVVVFLCEKVVVPTVMYGLEAEDMKVTERQKLNVLRLKATNERQDDGEVYCTRWHSFL